MQPNEIPNLEWYTRVSQHNEKTIRCPFATVEACPRYYQSLSLLGDAGSTKILEAEDQRLRKSWESNDLWPSTAEQFTSVTGEPGHPSTFSNFCPEITFERYGYFARTLTRYADELDTGRAHEHLMRVGTPPGHPNWWWSSCVAQHYTECSVYSVLSYRADHPTSEQRERPEPWWRKHLAKITVGIIVGIVLIVFRVIISRLFG